MPHTRGFRFTGYCLCGASWDARSSWPDDVRFFQSMWEKFHRGDGHGPATPSQAGRIRQREVKRLLSRSSDASTRSEGTATGT